MIVEAETGVTAGDNVTEKAVDPKFWEYTRVKRMILGPRVPVPETAFLSHDGTHVLIVMRMNHEYSLV